VNQGETLVHGYSSLELFVQQPERLAHSFVGDSLDVPVRHGRENAANALAARAQMPTSNAGFASRRKAISHCSNVG
jgi:hypothetical protein